MNFQLTRFYLMDLFQKFKYVFAAVILLSTVIVILQYSPAREFGKAYTQVSEPFTGPFSIEKDKRMEELIDKHAQMSSIAYDDLQNSWLENFINHGDNNSRVNVETQLWEESQRYLNGKGEYGNTVYEDILILSTLIRSYRDLSQVDTHKVQIQENIARNIDRSNSDTEYWTLLMEKSKNLKTTVEFYDMRAVHSFLISYATDWMFLFAIIIVLSTVFCADYEQNRYLLLFSMPIHPVQIGIHKILCSIFVALLCSAISTVLNLSVLIAHTTNFRSFLQPVQAIENMSDSLFNGTVLAYILLLITYKTVFYIFIAVVVTFISLVCRKMVYSLIASISMVGVSVLLSELMQIMSPYHILSQYNLLTLYSHRTFVAMDDFRIVFSNLHHNTTILFACIFVMSLIISTTIVACHRRISRIVVSS